MADENNENKKKRRKIDWALFIEKEETQREMAETEREMVARSEGQIFTSEDFHLFLEEKFQVSYLNISIYRRA